jgi:hypothetical protein
VSDFLMKWLILVAVQALASHSLVASAASASTLQFEFIFSNDRQNPGSIVRGLITGLIDNATSAATSVRVTSNTAGFGLGEYAFFPNDNRFTVENGVITAFRFIARGLDSASDDLTCCSLGLTSNGQNSDPTRYGAGLEHSPQGVAFNYVFMGAVAPLKIIPAPVPLPAAGVVFATALAALGLIRRRKKRVCAKACAA